MRSAVLLLILLALLVITVTPTYANVEMNETEKKMNARLEILTPEEVNHGENLAITARLLNEDGSPINGVSVDFYQKTQFGELKIGTGITGKAGITSIEQTINSPAVVTIRAATDGDKVVSAEATAKVIVKNWQPNDLSDQPWAQQLTTPNPFIVGLPLPVNIVIVALIFTVLGSVWTTYLYVISRIFAIRKEGRPK